MPVLSLKEMADDPRLGHRRLAARLHELALFSCSDCDAAALAVSGPGGGVVKYERGIIWYDKSATDDRVWCVSAESKTVRAAKVTFETGFTLFEGSGFKELQPGGPRGVIGAGGIETTDEVPCG